MAKKTECAISFANIAVRNLEKNLSLTLTSMIVYMDLHLSGQILNATFAGINGQDLQIKNIALNVVKAIWKKFLLKMKNGWHFGDLRWKTFIKTDIKEKLINEST